jgi:hypothetical protein
MTHAASSSVIPDATVLIEDWERAVAGRDTDALGPSQGLLMGLSVGVPFDVLLLLWVLA